MSYGFVAYIDESGDDGLKRVRPRHPNGSSEWFVLSAVVVRASNENAIGRLQRGILNKFHNPQRQDIHYRDLSDTRKTIACAEIGNAALRCFVVMSNKKNIQDYKNPRTFPEKNYLYWWLTRLLLERVTRFCAKWSYTLYSEPRPIKIILSQRGGMAYDRLDSYLRLLGFQTDIGHVYLKAGNLTWSVVDREQIYVAAHKNEAGLQIADVVAGAFYQSVYMDTKNPCVTDYARLLVPRLYRGPNNTILEHGIKPMPSLYKMALLPQQKAIFEHVGYLRNRW